MKSKLKCTVEIVFPENPRLGAQLFSPTEVSTNSSESIILNEGNKRHLIVSVRYLGINKYRTVVDAMIESEKSVCIEFNGMYARNGSYIFCRVTMKWVPDESSGTCKWKTNEIGDVVFNPHNNDNLLRSRAKFCPCCGEPIEVIENKKTSSVDSCTDPDNCRRCKSHSSRKHEFQHAGIPLGKSGK